MKTKSKKLLLLAAAVVIMLSFNSCKKYPDGPLFSLRSATARLVGKWKIVDGIDNDDVKVYLIFKKSGDFTEEVKYGSDNYELDGEWKWGTGKKTVIIEFDESSDESELTVLRLTNSEFWFKDDDDDEYKAEKQ